jgi:hypothetical protein
MRRGEKRCVRNRKTRISGPALRREQERKGGSGERKRESKRERENERYVGT